MMVEVLEFDGKEESIQKICKEFGNGFLVGVREFTDGQRVGQKENILCLNAGAIAIPVATGDYIARDVNGLEGEYFLIPKGALEDYYEPVTKTADKE